MGKKEHEILENGCHEKRCADEMVDHIHKWDKIHMKMNIHTENKTIILVQLFQFN